MMFIFLIALTQCENSAQVDSREYILNIKNTSGLPIDSIVVEREINGALDTVKFAQDDYNSTDSTIQISFDVDVDPNTSINVSYLGYSMGIPVIQKTDAVSGVNPGAVELLVEYRDILAVQDSATGVDSNEVMDSLFVAYTLKGGDSVAQQMYSSYVSRAGADTAFFFMILRDTLVGRGDQLPNLTLSDKLGIERETIRVLIAVADTLPDIVSSSSIMIQPNSSSTVVPVGTSSVIETPVVGTSSSVGTLSSVNVGVATKQFDFFGSISLHSSDVAKVILRMSGDSIIVPIEKEAAYNVELMKYSGFVELGTVGTNYVVEILVYDSLQRMTGYKLHAFTTLSFSIEIAPFDAWNAKPWVVVDSLANVSINDFIELKQVSGDSLNGGSILSVEWKHGAGEYVAQVDSVFKIVVPVSAHVAYPIYTRIIDSDSNVVLDSVFVDVLLDTPVISLSSVDTLIDISDSVYFNWSGSDHYGSIVEYKLKGAVDQYWTTVTSGSSIALRSPDNEGVLKYYLQATDDDGNVVMDSANVKAIVDPPFVSGVTLHGTAKQDSTLSVTYTYNDLLGDVEDMLAARIIWYRNGDSIVGEKNLEYAIQEVDSGKVISVGVIGHAKTGHVKVSIEAQSAPSTSVVGFNAPFVDSVWIEGVALFGNTLSGRYSFKDGDGDSEGASMYKWYRDGTHVTSVSGDEYVLAQADSGTVISFEVTPVENTSYSKSGLAVVDTSDVYDFQDARDGQLYRTVVIGDQIWMKENLNFDTLDGSGSYCYGNDSENCEVYGRLYNWEAMMIGELSSDHTPSNVNGICPSGMHIPSDAEWTDLYDYVSGQVGSVNAGLNLKSNLGWNTDNGNDSFGFYGMAGGYLSNLGSSEIGISGGWWSSTEHESNNTSAWYWVLQDTWNGFGKNNPNKETYFSVRCLGNKIPIPKIEGQLKPGIINSDLVFSGKGSKGNYLDSTLQYSWRVTGESNTSTSIDFVYHPTTIGLKKIFLNVTSGGVSSEDTITHWVHESVTDSRDGQVYPIVTIGAQTWMAANLNYDTLDASGSWCYEDDIENCSKYGRLYEWEAIMADESSSIVNPSGVKGICMDGYHVPSKSELEEFVSFIESEYSGQDLIKSLMSVNGWAKSFNFQGTDKYGFSLLPSSKYASGTYYNMQEVYLWSATEGDSSSKANYFHLGLSTDWAYGVWNWSKNDRHSLRCVKD